MTVHQDAKAIMNAALHAAMPDTAVEKALTQLPECQGKLVLIATGKAAWQMAAAAHKILSHRIHHGVVCTKYDHCKGPIGNLILSEGGHPVPDENSYKSTQLAIDAVKDLTQEDVVLFLVSGGGSALFEKPLIPEAEMADITRQLLACGADIVEINTLRKRLSAVKGGKFAQLCAPAKVFSIILSDVLGDPLDMIASGPAYPDSATKEQALAIIEKYKLCLSDAAKALMEIETPKTLENVESHITGSVKQLCVAAAAKAEELGYRPIVLTASLSCEARDAGSFLASIAQYHAGCGEKLAFIAGGETVVHLTGKGKGGRNQELALSGARGIRGLENAVLFSLGSDGTDGPTDAAGGIVDGTTVEKLKEKGISIDAVLQDNDAYNALKAVDSLIITGPTGTNVNDLSVLLMG